MRKDDGKWPFFLKFSLCDGVSAAAQCMHDFDGVAVIQQVLGMARSRDDFTIHFDRYAALSQPFGLQQLLQGVGA